MAIWDGFHDDGLMRRSAMNTSKTSPDQTLQNEYR
ncbi:hypothetical protein F441_01990 [Phytophthora nicotianae CJ01A1]|uniref:Uncharacterized protein n=4 Tax=Phytophthora nicotianae TaxID=4792 RepID=W2PDT0_PHYN3|nr:hypothetical protein PPTG_24512 [Phytophthora nicotianae INRA-310]ETI55285.1 hypothetical protein F443_02026 [Phytophthora nicotianae P1569]ETK95105.1 hypothetical protein L915_01941 [Phytophthora nicotianae]ETP25113.1 hypothetical protein F441_01990 [Phytophthora nicotianae CJ01A1]ETL48502.1 hypothetical protein L916_01902 [Phytophthora nicotianae]ETM01586.1 hypothetical protein L917_01854 [Phytophthora nicotianae]